MSEPVKIAIVDDHPVMRGGLRALLQAHAGFAVVGEAADIRSALALASSLLPDVMIVDLRLGEASGIELIRELRDRRSRARIVVYTNYSNEADVYEALAAGGDAYVLKDADPQEVVAAVIAVHRGRRYVSAGASGRLAEHVQTTPLTPRELDVLALIVQGKTNKAIGRLLAIGEETVKCHVKNILGKLSVGRRAEAAARAIQRGLVRID